MTTQQIIEREAERYLEHPYKDLYQDAVLISSVRKAVIHGANFALGMILKELEKSRNEAIDIFGLRSEVVNRSDIEELLGKIDHGF